MKFGFEKLANWVEAPGAAPVPPNAASKMGNGISPGTPVLSANVVPPLSAKSVCAFWNSFKNPFSKMLVSLRSEAIHMCTAWLPT